MGNACELGGSTVTCSCTSAEVTADVADLGNGSYKVAWTCQRLGSYEGHVKIDGHHVVNSPVSPARVDMCMFVLAQCVVPCGVLGGE